MEGSVNMAARHSNFDTHKFVTSELGTDKRNNSRTVYHSRRTVLPKCEIDIMAKNARIAANRRTAVR